MARVASIGRLGGALGRRSDLTPEETRARLLAAASELFSERGFDGVSIRDIARGAGVGSSIIGYHFGDKAGLMRAVVAAYFSSLAEIAPLLSMGEQTTQELLRVAWTEIYARRDAVRVLYWEIIGSGQLRTEIGGYHQAIAAFGDRFPTSSPLNEDMRLRSMAYLLGRYALNTEEELVALTGAETVEEAHAAVVKHLTVLADALFFL